MRRIDHDVVKRPQQQMYEHYGTSTEAEKKKLARDAEIAVAAAAAAEYQRKLCEERVVCVDRVTKEL